MYMPLTYDPKKILAFIRQSNNQIALIALNFNKKEVALVLSSQLLKDDWKLLISNKRDTPPTIFDRKITLFGNEAMVLLKQDHQFSE